MTDKILETESEESTIKGEELTLTYSKNDSTQKKLMSIVNKSGRKDVGRQAVIFGIVDEESDSLPSQSDEQNAVAPYSKPTK